MLSGVGKKAGHTDNFRHDPLDRLIAGVAARQHGHVTRRQLLELRASRHAIAHRVANGRLIRVHAGVYAVGHLTTTPVARAAAAVLACGPDAALSHHWAAALWGFGKGWPAPIEVTVGSHRARPGILIHRSATLQRTDVTSHLGIRVSTPARTLLDVAPSLTDRALIRAVADALHSRYLQPGELAEVIRRNPGRSGERLAACLDANGPTRSELEDAFVAFVARHRLPAPRVNARFAGREVDALFPEHGLIVELDGWDFHRSRVAFENDRERDAQMLANGIATVRVTWERLHAEPEREADRLRAILAARAQLLRSSQTRVA
ncbi:MAG: hypothetical protein JOZ64_13000 [Solirubrobacterales bacterium]|nr:hypothetical protein [Solirubrobacterales bacterium]